MKNFGYGVLGQITGGIVAVLGINLPGLILVLFIVPFWDDLKKINRIKHSLSGINAVSVGFIIAAFILLLRPIGLELSVHHYYGAQLSGFELYQNQSAGTCYSGNGISCLLACYSI